MFTQTPNGGMVQVNQYLMSNCIYADKHMNNSTCFGINMINVYVLSCQHMYVHTTTWMEALRQLAAHTLGKVMGDHACQDLFIQSSSML